MENNLKDIYRTTDIRKTELSPFGTEAAREEEAEYGVWDEDNRGFWIEQNGGRRFLPGPKSDPEPVEGSEK
jgi:hypothetical protein